MGKIHDKTVELYYIREKLARELNQMEYLKVVHHYIQYYYRRAQVYKVWYLALNAMKLLILAVIPVSQAIPWANGIPWLVAGASSLCILLESFMGLFHMKDKWILYRKVGNDLMREERKYATEACGYDNAEEVKNFRMFVTNIENIIGNESSDWNRMVQTVNAENGDGT